MNVSTRLAAGVVALLMLASGVALAQVRGSEDEARALAERALAHVRVVGLGQALEAFNDPQGEFVHLDLHVFVVGFDGEIRAHGYKRAFVGKSMQGVTDANGRSILDEVLSTAREQGAGWTDPYPFPDPYTGKLGAKRSYVIAYADVVIGVGVYAQ